MILSDLSRLCRIARVLLRYHLAVLIPLLPIKFPLHIASGLLFFSSYRYRQLTLGERLRLALQELGPVWIKLGQMLSTRRDLLPIEIADQLALLQDRVSPFDGKTARIAIEKMLGGPLEKWFDNFNEQPLACASIAQIHTAYLKDSGCEVVLKVIRPEIHALMIADIRLMYLVARCVQRWSPASHRLRPLEVVQEYEKTLLSELNLIREAANALQLRRNFNDSPLLYIPEVFIDHCRDGVMVMERIDGIPVSDIVTLQAHGINLQLLAERGVQIFFTQVFRDSLFHADMHPGNIFVSRAHPEQPQYIGVDFGIVGSLNRQDKHYLASNFIAFFNRDYRRVAELHVASGWVPPETNIEEFEFAIHGVCEPIFQKPLAEISFSHVLVTLFSTARRFNIIIQPQLLLLQKTLLCVEGLGRQLYPQLDLWTTAKPFLEAWMQEQVGWPAAWRTLKEKSPIWLERLPQLPELLYDTLHQQQHLQRQLVQQQREQQHRYDRDSTVRCWFSIGMTLLLCSVSLIATGVSCWIQFMVASGIAWLIGWYYFMV